MAKKGLKLSDVLSEFNKSLEKNAEFGEELLPEEGLEEAPAPAVDEDEVITEVAKEVAATDEQHKASVEVLKDIASAAAENEELLLAKEASEFGKLFANAVYTELQDKAEADEFVSKTAEETYNSLVLNDITEEAYANTQLAAIEKQAYDVTDDELANLDPEVLEALALEEEEEAALEEEGEEELTPEEEAALEEEAYAAAMEELAEEEEAGELTPEEAAALEEALVAAYNATEDALSDEQ